MRALIVTMACMCGVLHAEEASSTNLITISVDERDGFVFECKGPAEEQGGVTNLVAETEDDVMPSLPGPESSTNEVAIVLLQQTALATVDNFECSDENGSYTMSVVTPTWTWDGFLGADETNGWTKVAKKACFDWYLDFLSTNACSSSDEQARLAEIAVNQCRELSYTNSWSALVSIASNMEAPCRDEAGELAMEFAPFGASMISFGTSIYTNGIPCEAMVRGAIVRAYAKRLQRENSAVSTNATYTLFGCPFVNVEAAMSLDQLFVSKIQGYGVSSNRLVAAQAVLASPNSWEFQNNYFAGITNRLMNASQPLLQVPEY